MSEHAIQNAVAHIESLTHLMELIDRAESTGNQVHYEGQLMGFDKLSNVAREAALAVTVRSGWHTPDCVAAEPEEYCILLTTGGPALRITGNLNDGNPDTAVLEWQVWGIPWTRYEKTTTEGQRALLDFARLFWFGATY